MPVDSDDYEERGNAEPEYRDPAGIDSSELRTALSSLYLLGDDPYLRIQAFNLSIVDQFIMQLEYEALGKLGEEQRTPMPEAVFLSAQSQMWIFAAYELLRTWRERAKDVLKLHANGGLQLKIDALEQELGFVHIGREIRAAQLRKVLDTPELLDQIATDLRLTHMSFARLEYIRVALAKHEVGGNKRAIAYMPGYGRINRWCGSLDYEIEIRGGVLGAISRRDIADDLRAISNRENPPTDDDLRSFDAFMKGPPSNPPS